MSRRKILWLTSWYPNAADPFDGDFIQRHAHAAAINHDVHVIFVTEAGKGMEPGEKVRRATGLTEQVIYTPPVAGLFSRVRKGLRWKDTFQKAVTDYIDKHGKPHAVHVHIPWKAGIIALWMKQKYGIPFLVSEHWGFYAEEGSDKATWQTGLLKRIYGEAQGVITVSQYLSDLLKKTMGRPADLILPNVVDTTLFFHKEEKYDRFTFIHVSNMMPVKQVEGILEAFARLLRSQPGNRAQLILVGNRDQTFVEQARRMGLLNISVFFRGEVPYTQVAEEMRRSHCLVLFSRSETFSCVTAEALCCGLLVVASAAGALPELVSDSNGILVPPTDVQALMTALRTVQEDYHRFSSAVIAREGASRWGYTPVSEAFDRLYTERLRRQA